MNRNLVAVLLSIAALVLVALPAAAAAPSEPQFQSCPMAAASEVPLLDFGSPAPVPLTGPPCGPCGIPGRNWSSVGAACTDIGGHPGFCEYTGKVCLGHPPQCACFRS